MCFCPLYASVQFYILSSKQPSQHGSLVFCKLKTNKRRKKKKVFIRHLVLYLHVSVVFPVVVCVVVMGTVQRWWSFPIPERSLCFAILCCPGWAGHDSPSSVRLRPTSMPALSRGDHSPLTFSEGEEAKRDRRVEQTLKKISRLWRRAQVCERYFKRKTEAADFSSRKSHTQIFTLWCGWSATCWPAEQMDGGEYVCVSVCLCLGKREAAGRSVLHLFLLVSFCFLSLLRLTEDSKKS